MRTDIKKLIFGNGVKGHAFVFFFACLFVLSVTEANAQCAMCRAALESEESGIQAKAVNDGIVYLMAIPYLLVGVIGYFVYRLKYGKKSSKLKE